MSNVRFSFTRKMMCLMGKVLVCPELRTESVAPSRTDVSLEASSPAPGAPPPSPQPAGPEITPRQAAITTPAPTARAFSTFIARLYYAAGETLLQLRLISHPRGA